jgi:hypothetical protein
MANGQRKFILQLSTQAVPTLMLAFMAAAFVVVAATADGAELKFHAAPGIDLVVGRYIDGEEDTNEDDQKTPVTRRSRPCRIDFNQSIHDERQN